MAGPGGLEVGRPSGTIVPSPLVTMGRILGAFGVKGWVKVAPFSAAPGALCDYPKWWIGERGDWREVSVESSEAHARTVVAKLSGYEVRETVAVLKGCAVAVLRADLPAAAADEIYWADIVGLQVVNLQGEALGLVTEVFSNGAHAVLRVAEEGRKEERLLPYVDAVVREVVGGVSGEHGRVGIGHVVVDWGADW